jgi:hypothetical protein
MITSNGEGFSCAGRLAQPKIKIVNDTQSNFRQVVLAGFIGLRVHGECLRVHVHA